MATRVETTRNLISTEAIQFIRPIILRLSIILARPNTILHVFFDEENVDHLCTMAGTSDTKLVSDAFGSSSIELKIPGGQFNTGTRNIVVTDAIDLSHLTTTGSVYGSATGTFTSTGKIDFFQTTQTTIETIEVQQIVQVQTDPLAQSFFTTNVAGGVFVTSIDLFFQTKDTSMPVWIELRTMNNGYPAKLESTNSNLFSWVEPTDVNTSNDASLPTKFRFPEPIYLKENSDYCFVVRSNSNNYNLFTSKMGETSIETGRTIFEQPYVGSLFKSENNITWQAEQFEDIKFILNVARFDTSAGTDIKFYIDTPYTNSSGLLFSTVSGSNVVTYTHPQEHGLEIGSRIDIGSHSGPSNTVYNGITGANMLGEHIVTEVPDRNTVKFQTANTATSTGVMSSSNVVTEIKVISGGINYSSDTTLSFVGVGSGVTATPVISGGIITSITITNHGSGYTTAPAIVISSTTGSGASLIALVEPAFTVAVNKPFSAMKSSIKVNNLPGTNTVANFATTIGNYDGGNLTSYTPGKQYEIDLTGKYHELNQNSLIASRSNEYHTMSNSHSALVEIQMSTDNPNVSPVLDLTVAPEIIMYNKKINSLSDETVTATISTGTVTNIVVSNSGSGYTLPPVVTVIGDAGTSTTATAVLTSTMVTSITVNTSSFGYKTTPIVVIKPATGDTTGSGAAAAAVLSPYNTELLSVGGNAKSKYVTKKAVLSTISTSIRLTAIIGSGPSSSVDWYIRSSLSGSNSVHDELGWTRLNCSVPRNKSSSGNEPYEYEFTLDNISPFDTYDLKCVLLANDPTKSPAVHSYRAIILA